MRTIVVLNLSRTVIPKLLARANTIVNAIAAASSELPSPTPSVATLQAQIAALETEQKDVQARVPGASASRDAKAAVLVSSLEQARTYVQTLCDAAPEQASTLIAAAAMQAKASPLRNKPVLAALPGVASGSAVLVANRSALVARVTKSVTFLWQSSVDGGKTWSSAAATPLARATVTGFTPATTVSFRVSVVVSTTEGPWSQPVSLLIH
jgi:hypothetical protein